jgi:hypothetical protein
LATLTVPPSLGPSPLFLLAIGDWRLACLVATAFGSHVVILAIF